MSEPSIPNQAPRTTIGSRILRAVIAVAGLAVLLAANYYLRRTLERSDVFIYSFFGNFYPEVEKQMFSWNYPWLKMLLPVPELSGAWVTTTLIVTHLVELWLTPPVTWYVFNAALMVVSFITSWLAFRSLAFSFTFVIAMGFGTQLYATYAVTGAMGLYLLLIYYEIVLLALLRVVQGARPIIGWRALLIISILVTALGYESWLDFAVFLWMAAALTGAVAYRFDKREWWAGLRFACVCLALVFAAYLYIKINFGYGQGVGAESDIVFNYPALSPKIEDVISNVLTQFYIVITNFLPPMFVSSTAFYDLGAEKLVEYQHGYHGSYSYLVVMQYLFLWRYYAGAAFAVFCYLMFRTVRSSLQVWSPAMFTVAILLLMIATGGPTHAFVKARPMNSMPVLGYHVIVGVMGVALLMAYFAQYAIARWRRGGGILIVVALWLMVFYGALARPGMLSHAAGQIGLGVGIYPDPWVVLASKFGWTTTPKGGAQGYRLTPYTPAVAAAVAAESARTVVPPPADAPVPFGGRPERLPNEVPDLSKWTTAAGVAVAPGLVGYRVVTNGSDGAYQVSSPSIAVPPQHRMLVRLQGTTVKGRPCMGVLDQEGNWLVPPVGDRAEFSLDTRDNKSIMFVFIECGRTIGFEAASAFEVESVSYAVLANTASAAARQ